jgi:hypothetical protein
MTIAKQLDGLLKYTDAKQHLKYSNYKGDMYQHDKEVLDWLLANNCEIRGYAYSQSIPKNGPETFFVRAYVKDLFFNFGCIGYHRLMYESAERNREYLVYLLNRTSNIKAVVTKTFETYDEVCSKFTSMIDESTGVYKDGSIYNIFSSKLMVVKKYKNIEKQQLRFENFCKTFVEKVGKETPNF